MLIPPPEQEAPEFTIENLPPGTGFTIRLLAFNHKGESDRVELRGFTLGVDTQKHIRYTKQLMEKMLQIV
jgi:hypothetical protein